MAAGARRSSALFEAGAYRTFRFLDRELAADGVLTLRYGLDEELTFTEHLRLPVPGALTPEQLARAQGLLSLLHWVAGVSYYKTAAPPSVSFEAEAPPPAVAALLEALYSEGLGEFAYSNRLHGLPRPRFALGGSRGAPAAASTRAFEPARVLVPVGGGKDSIVAIEIVRRSGRELALFSIGDAPPIARTVAVAGLDRLQATRTLDPGLRALNEAGALNGHVPVTAIVASVSLLTAALHGFDAVAMANERSASAGNVSWDGVEVNHQFSKSLRVERLLAAALAELDAPVRAFSIVRPASELSIARAFARMSEYHGAFTSCNTIFRLDPDLRGASWCCECPKCRFVYLALAPFSTPERLRAIFGRDLLAEEHQFEGFALLCADGGHKPFECVGEEQESLAACRLLALDRRWHGHAVVRRLREEVLPRRAEAEGDPAEVLRLSEEHEVPDVLMAEVRALLGA